MIIRVNSKKLLNEFIKFPYKLYDKCPYYPKPLFIEQRGLFEFNRLPFFKHAKVKLFLFVDEKNKVLGRIAGIINYNHNKFWQEKIGFFGFFESINNFDVAKKLFEAVEEWFITEDIKIIRGPTNFSTNETCGLLINAFDEVPSIMMPYNYEYYIDLLEKNGFTKIKDLLAFQKDELELPDKTKRFVEIIKKRYNVTVRKINLKNIKAEIEIIKQIYNSAWEKNWGFIPMTDEEFYYSVKDLKFIADEDLIYFAEINNKPVGFIVFLPDINEILIKCNGHLTPLTIYRFMTGLKKCRNMRCLIMGILKEYRGKGIDILLYYACYEGVKNKTIKVCELSWLLEDNLSIINPLKKIGAFEYRRYRIYQKELKS